MSFDWLSVGGNADVVFTDGGTVSHTDTLVTIEQNDDGSCTGVLVVFGEAPDSLMASVLSGPFTLRIAGSSITCSYRGAASREQGAVILFDA